MGVTSDPNDPRLGRGVDAEPIPQHEVYLVLSEEERAKGFVRPYRDAYRHDVCGTVTTMGRALSETYARQPTFYGATYCCHCRMHKPVSEFVWVADGERVGS
jgi:hypothetical protein